jgi:hypothetical protein
MGMLILRLVAYQLSPQHKQEPLLALRAREKTIENWRPRIPVDLEDR